MKAYDARLTAIEEKVTQLNSIVDARKKIHAETNLRFSAITSDYNKLLLEKDVLQEKFNKIALDQAVQNSSVERVFKEMDRVFKEIVEIKQDFKDEIIEIKKDFRQQTKH